MPASEVLIYRSEDGSIPLIDWLKQLQATNEAAFKKCVTLIDLLEQYGHELRRPRADMLRDGVYELRTEVRNPQYRVLYGFVGKNIALLSHGLTKTAKVPARDIDLAIARLKQFQADPQIHTATKEELDG